MEQTFPEALAAVLSHEGGWSDDPRDPGGATFRGVTLATLSAWRGRPAARAELAALAPAEIEAIYRDRYWRVVGADRLPAGLDYALFDAAVNAGPRRAALLLQEAVGVRRDGLVGPLTRSAAEALGAPEAVRRLCAARRRFLQGLPTWPVYGRGWSRRIDEVERRALALAAAPHPPPTPQSKEPHMIGIQSVLASRTIWSNLVGLAALGLQRFGYDGASLDAGGLTDAVLQTVTAGSFIASSLFRVLATRRIGT